MKSSLQVLLLLLLACRRLLNSCRSLLLVWQQTSLHVLMSKLLLLLLGRCLRALMRSRTWTSSSCRASCCNRSTSSSSSNVGIACWTRYSLVAWHACWPGSSAQRRRRGSCTSVTAYHALRLEDNHLSQQKPLLLLAIGQYFANNSKDCQQQCICTSHYFAQQ